MPSSRAWQRHGCYVLGSAQYYDFPLDKALRGCRDNWNSQDHFDPTSPSRRLLSRFNHLRTVYPALQDGFNLVQWGNKTRFVQLPGSNSTPTELGLWYVSRAALPSLQNFTGQYSDQVYLLYTNENRTIDYTFDCQSEGWITSPYVSGTTLRNLFAPFESYTLRDSQSPYFNDSSPPYRGCISTITFEPWSFKALVPEEMWVPPRPMLTKFIPGHDARILTTSSSNDTTMKIALQFNMEMSCDGVTQAVSLNVSSSGNDLFPRVRDDSVNCGLVDDTDTTYLVGDVSSAWQWSATLDDVPDGIIEVTVTRPPNSDGSDNTHAVDHLLVRKGTKANVMVFPELDYDKDGEALQLVDDHYVFTHQARGAELFRYSWNFGQSYTRWMPYENETVIPAEVFDACLECFWEGQHIIVQCKPKVLSPLVISDSSTDWADLTSSTAHVLHADRGHRSPRRFPQMLVRGPYNTWGYDRGVPAKMENKDGMWEVEVSQNLFPYFLSFTVARSWLSGPVSFKSISLDMTTTSTETLTVTALWKGSHRILYLPITSTCRFPPNRCVSLFMVPSAF